MINQLNQKVQTNIRQLKRKYLILKIKWVLLFVLPILITVLAYHVCKQFLKLRMKELGHKIKENGIHHDTDKQPKS